MSPEGLLTVNTPLATTHFAGDASLAVTHWSRSFPSNKTTASEGASALVRPGVMIAGTGFQTSVSAGLGDDDTGFWARAIVGSNARPDRVSRDGMVDLGWTAKPS